MRDGVVRLRRGVAWSGRYNGVKTPSKEGRERERGGTAAASSPSSAAPGPGRRARDDEMNAVKVVGAGSPWSTPVNV
jgi:hypothetical protein